MPMHASTMGTMVSLWPAFWPPRSEAKKLMSILMRWWAPRLYRNLRMSSWNRMMRPITPTLTNLSMMEPRSRISSICDTNIQTTTNTMMPMNTLSERDSFISLYR